MGPYVLALIEDLLLYSKVKVIVERFGVALQRVGLGDLPAGLEEAACRALIVDLTHYGESILTATRADNPKLVRVGIAGHLETGLIGKARAQGFQVVVRSALEPRLAEIIRGLIPSD